MAENDAIQNLRDNRNILGKSLSEYIAEARQVQQEQSAFTSDGVQRGNYRSPMRLHIDPETGNRSFINLSTGKVTTAVAGQSGNPLEINTNLEFDGVSQRNVLISKNADEEIAKNNKPVMISTPGVYDNEGLYMRYRNEEDWAASFSRNAEAVGIQTGNPLEVNKNSSTYSYRPIDFRTAKEASTLKDGMIGVAYPVDDEFYDEKDATIKSVDGLSAETTHLISVGGTSQEAAKTIGTRMLGNNLLLPKDVQTVDYKYRYFNRFGWINPYNYDRAIKEFVFFTKPDLNLFSNVNQLDQTTLVGYNKSGSTGIACNPFIVSVAAKNPWVLGQLQDLHNTKIVETYSPFMNIFTNNIASKLEMPGIDSESQESTQNIMGTSISYRGHSLKSDNGYDFSLSFVDNSSLEIYSAVKAYDEYIRYLKQGIATPKKDHIENHIDPTKFSIYKFVIGSDGETIMYFAKFTGCYFKDVPRSEFGDWPDGQTLKYSVSFHADFVEDMNPQIISDFDKLIISSIGINELRKRQPITQQNFIPVHDKDGVNNQWATYPYIIKGTKTNSDGTGSVYSKRIDRRGNNYDYFLKWV